jgi:glutamate-1-semialdehyde 2,1-aminomutase
MKPRYANSGELLERALRSIPLGTQTFSKSTTQYPRGVSPHFLARGRGARVWDVDGNEYVDLVCALAAVSLGYCDPDVDAAVQAQLESGVSFSLAHPLEMEVAEAVIELVPCAERVRFGKNGSDATAGAVRLARAFTGRERVAVCGYHGWQDWYIGSTARNLGVPESTRALTSTFAYDDADALERLLASAPFAAVVMEPMNVTVPAPGYLQRVRELCTRHGALLVFDETVTGFRYALGGAQALFGVTPDLATFGKGLANGLPLSFVAGRADVMRLMEEIFFSTTFGGETLALAAARAVIGKMRREPVLAAIAARGRDLMDGARARVEAAGLSEVIRIGGHPSWSFLTFADAAPYSSFELKTLFMQECLARGVLTLGTHNPCYALSERDVQHVLGTYDEVLPMLRAALDRRDLASRLRCQPLVPLFRVR